MALGGLGRGRHRRKLNADVNIINLVDVVLVLLIIFMITAPMMQGAIQVDLPRAVAAPPKNSDAVVITVFKDGKVKIGEGGVTSLENVAATFKRMVALNPKLTANIMTDTHASAGELVAVFDALRLAGASTVNVITRAGN